MAKIDKPKKTVKSKPKKNLAPNKLLLLITIVPREKAEFYEDFIQGFGVNASFTVYGKGTAPSEVLTYLGAGDSSKGIVLSVITENKEKELMLALDEKFKKVRGGKGVAFTIPLTSTIGVAIYKFLADMNK